MADDDVHLAFLANLDTRHHADLPTSSSSSSSSASTAPHTSPTSSSSSSSSSSSPLLESAPAGASRTPGPQQAHARPQPGTRAQSASFHTSTRTPPMLDATLREASLDQLYRSPVVRPPPASAPGAGLRAEQRLLAIDEAFDIAFDDTHLDDLDDLDFDDLGTAIALDFADPVGGGDGGGGDGGGDAVEKSWDGSTSGSESGSENGSEEDEGKWRRRSIAVLDSVAVTLFMFVVTIFVLFVDDALVIWAPEKDDDLDYGMLLAKNAVFVVFLIELVWTSWAKGREYFLTFFFWLDLLALVSFAPDVLLLVADYDLVALVSTLAIARTGRAARASARAARLVRVVRVVKFARIVQRGHDEVAGEENMIDALESRINASDSFAGRRALPIVGGGAGPESGVTEEDALGEPSRLGAQLISRTTNKVIFIVLVLFLVTSLAQVEPPWRNHLEAGLSGLERAAVALGQSSPAFVDGPLAAFVGAYGDELLWLRLNGIPVVGEYARVGRIREVYIQEAESASKASQAWVDVKSTEVLQAIFNIALLVFIILLMALGNMLITRDANRLLIVPFSSILSVVRVLLRHTKMPGQDGRARRAAGSEHGGGSGVVLVPASVEGGETRPRGAASEAEELLRMLSEIDGTLALAQHDVESKEMLVRIQEAELETVTLRTVQLESTLCVVVSWLGEETSARWAAWRGWCGFEPLADSLSAAMDDGSGASAEAVLARVGRSGVSGALPSIAALQAHAGELVYEVESGSGPSERTQVQLEHGRLEHVVEQLCHPSAVDTDFDLVFLLTFRTYMVPLELLLRLVGRLALAPDASTVREAHDGLAAYHRWTVEVRAPVRARVVRIVRLWMAKYFFDFERDGRLVAVVAAVVVPLLRASPGYGEAADKLLALLEKKMRGVDDNESSFGGSDGVTETTSSSAIALPRMSGSGRGRLSLASVDAVEAARQLTLVEHALYTEIGEQELLNLAWSRDDAGDAAPNVLALIDHFNDITQWVQVAILSATSAKARGARVRKFIDILDQLYSLNNFNGAMELVSGLSSAAVSRLRRTWKEVDAVRMARFEEVSAALSALGNYAAHRRTVADVFYRPSTPYLGMYLGDLVFIDEGNEDYVGDGRINVSKCYQIARVIQLALRWRKATYSFFPVAEVRTFLTAAVARVKSEPMDDKMLYALSLKVEPRKTAK